MAGNIKIIEARENFQRVPREIIFTPDVDAFTLGVYVKVLCLGVKWELNVNGLAKVVGCSADRIRKVFAVLEGAGYLRRSRAQDQGGHFTGWDYEISAEPLTNQEGKTPTSVNHRHRENTDVGKTPTSVKTGGIYIDSKGESSDSIGETIDTNSAPFDFRRSLLALGVSAEVADAWLQVRKGKRATNTQIAFEATAREIAKAGISADDCIRIAVERSWSGFSADWIKDNPKPLTPTPSPAGRISGKAQVSYAVGGMWSGNNNTNK